MLLWLFKNVEFLIRVFISIFYSYGWHINTLLAEMDGDGDDFNLHWEEDVESKVYKNISDT